MVDPSLVTPGAGCDETAVGEILYGRSKRLMDGAVYEFQCDENTTCEGSSMIYCDGARWNDTKPWCLGEFLGGHCSFSQETYGDTSFVSVLEMAKHCS